MVAPSCRSVVAAVTGGVVSDSTPHSMSEAANVLVHTVANGPVMGPSRYPVPYEDEPVQVAAVLPFREQLRCAVISPDSVPSYRSVLGPSAKVNGRSASSRHDGDESLLSPQKMVYVVAALSCYKKESLVSYADSIRGTAATYTPNNTTTVCRPVLYSVSRQKDRNRSRACGRGGCRAYCICHGCRD